ncbi:MAG TPA: tetratricopeptide repeat protein [Micavibrio sp.]|nr:tetratricopeptide repeat protein [Micavibrio sp.]HIL28610.1 tetratricopeptide repeat protein [Micavibrio sp.]
MTSDDKKDDADQVTGLSLDDDADETAPTSDAGPSQLVKAAASEDEPVGVPQNEEPQKVAEEDLSFDPEAVRTPVVDQSAVVSSTRNEEQVGLQDDFDAEDLDDVSMDELEADVHITGDESLDFADDMDRGGIEDVVAASEVAKKKGGSLKFVAPVAVLLIAAGVGGYIVTNPDILGGGNETTVVAPSIVAPPSLSDDIAALDTDVPQPVASENEVPRMPESGDEGLASNLSEDLAGAPAADVPAEPIAAGGDPAFPAGLEQELAAMDGGVLEMQSAAFEDAKPVEDAVVEQGSAEAAIEEPEVLEVPDNGAVVEDDAPIVDLTEKVEAESTAEIQLAQADTAPPEMPLMPTPAPMAEQKPYEQNVSDTAQAAPTEQSKPLIKSASDTYYDGGTGSTLPPVGGQNATAGLRAVDPVLEPASQYVVVNKDRGASDYESMVVAAKRALKLKRYDSALEMYEQLYAKNKRDPRVLMGLAVAQQNSGLEEAALQTYDSLLALDKGNADAMLNMLGLLKKQYPAVALRRLTELQQEYPRNSMVAAQLGVTYADQGDYEQAFRYLGIASSIEPDNAQHLFNIAITADRVGKRKEAIKYYEKALEADAVYGSGRTIPRETIYDRLSVLRR